MAASSSNADKDNYFLLTLDYVENMVEKRASHREEHLNGAKKASGEGYCVMAGALTDPVDTGVFVFKNCSREKVETFVKNDAYYRAGLIPSYTIRPWMVVVGGNS